MELDYVAAEGFQDHKFCDDNRKKKAICKTTLAIAIYPYPCLMVAARSMNGAEFNARSKSRLKYPFCSPN